MTQRQFKEYERLDKLEKEITKAISETSTYRPNPTIDSIKIELDLRDEIIKLRRKAINKIREKKILV